MKGTKHSWPRAIAHTAREIAGELLPETPIDDILCWPPDLFAFTSSVLLKTGAYRWVVAPPRGRSWPLPEKWGPPCTTREWLERVRSLADVWARWLTKHDLDSGAFALQPRLRPDEILPQRRAPTAILDAWSQATAKMDPPHGGDIDELNDEEKLATDDQVWVSFSNLVLLHCVVDELCAGWGMAPSTQETWYTRMAFSTLAESGTLATIHPSRGRVLPKTHTPQVGIALRSLSQNVAFVRTSVKTCWARSVPGRPIESSQPINCLLLPWPLEVHAEHFKPTTKRISLHPRYAEFSYEPRWPDTDIPKLLERCLVQAKARTGTKRIDLVVLPEAALVPSLQGAFEKTLADQDVSVYVAGFRGERDVSREADVADDTTRSVNYDSNFACMRQWSFGKERSGWSGIEQHKHHRWKLDRQQLLSYELDGQLSLSYAWWEAIGIPDRRLTLLPVGRNLVFSALICEDLARQDPVAEVIRAVGPSLVITLLMDGPQVAHRWASRYATVLADDPGSAVLSITSAGMVTRWQRAHHETGPAVVGLWRERSGRARELALDDGSHGLLLRLHAGPCNELTADGRESSRSKLDLELGTYEQIRVADAP